VRRVINNKSLYGAVYECGCLVKLEPLNYQINTHCMQHREPISHFVIVCRDCGIITPIRAKGHKRERCQKCQEVRNRERAVELGRWQRKYGKRRNAKFKHRHDFDKKLREIAEDFGVSKEAIRQIESRGLKRFVEHWKALHEIPELEDLYPIDQLPFVIKKGFIDGA